VSYKKGGIAVHVVEVTGDQYTGKNNVERRLN
jgi:hypothetical protein